MGHIWPLQIAEKISDVTYGKLVNLLNTEDLRPFLYSTLVTELVNVLQIVFTFWGDISYF